jgi:hypothetical protein
MFVHGTTVCVTVLLQTLVSVQGVSEILLVGDDLRGPEGKRPSSRRKVSVGSGAIAYVEAVGFTRERKSAGLASLFSRRQAEERRETDNFTGPPAI